MIAASASGLIIAGGQSTRLGQDKRVLPTPSGLSQLDLTIRQLSTIVDDLVLALREPDHGTPIRPVTVVFDEHPKGGPLAGLCVGLEATRYERVLVVACDLPLLNPAVLQRLLEISLDEGADLTVPRRADGTLEMLQAVYQRSIQSIARARLAAGRFKLAGLAADLLSHGRRVRFVADAELLPFDPELQTFFNLNTPADLERLRGLRGQTDRPPR